MSERKTVNLSIRVPPELAEAISRLAAEDRRSVNQMINLILEKAIKKEREGK